MRPSLLPLLLLPIASALVRPGLAEPAREDRYGGYVETREGLDLPRDAAFTERGTLLVVEAGACRVVELNSRGQIVRSLGRPGAGPDELWRPSAVDVDSGAIAVADTGNHRVVLYDTAGARTGLLGGEGDAPGRFRSPAGVALDGPRVVIADTGNHRIQVLDRTGRVQRVWGAFGGGPGEFRDPVDVAVDAGHRIYVADRGNHRVQRFKADGTFDGAWGARGPWPGLFASPTGVAVAGTQFVVTDRDNHRLQAFENDGTWIYEWGLHAVEPHEGQGKLHYPRRVAIEPGGRRAVVVEPLEGRLQWFELVAHEHDGGTGSSRRLATGGPAPHFGPGLAVAGDLAAFFEPETQTIEIYDVSGHMPIRISRLGGFGDTWGSFRELSALALDPRTWTLYAGDSGARRLASFRLAHDPEDPPAYDPALSAFLVGADLPRLLAREGLPLPPGCSPELEPSAIAVHPDGRRFVADGRAPRILVLGADWSPLEELWPLPKTAAGSPGSITALSLAPDGRTLWILDGARCRIVAHALDARSERDEQAPVALRDFGERGRGPGQLWEPRGLLATAGGELLVADSARDRVLRFDARGTFLGEWGGTGLLGGEFHRPAGLGQDEQGRLYVVDHGNHRVQLFEPDGAFLVAFGSRLYVKPTWERPAR